MSTLLVVARTVHFASVMLLFGELVFALFVARTPWHGGDHTTRHDDVGVDRRLTVLASWSVAVSIASGVAWLAAEAASMSGLPLRLAISRGTLGLVLGRTVFGRLWIMRFALVVGIGLVLLTMARSSQPQRRSRLQTGTLVLVAMYLGALAWAGHAAASRGSERFIQVISDVAHLLAAGAWLGALPGLVFLLARVPAMSTAAQATPTSPNGRSPARWSCSASCPSSPAS